MNVTFGEMHMQVPMSWMSQAMTSKLAWLWYRKIETAFGPLADQRCCVRNL